MTTIAANTKEMACDSMISTGFVDFPGQKIYGIGDSLVGAAGDHSAISKFVAWFADGCRGKTPKMGRDEYFEALELNRSGLWYWANSFHPILMERGFHCIGAGGQAAMAVMMAHNATPSEAVSVACDVTPSTCARPIVVHGLRPAPSRKKGKK